MLLVGRMRGPAHCQQRHGRGKEIDTGMHRLGKDAQAVRRKSDDQLRAYQQDGSSDRDSGNPFLPIQKQPSTVSEALLTLKDSWMFQQI
jgi:hypothetical protein